MSELKKCRQRLALVMVAGALVAGEVTVVGAQVVINEVSYTGAGADDWVEIKNLGPGTADVSNYWFCARFSYARVGLLVLLDGTDFVLDPGEIVTVRAWRDLNNTASDLGLYTSTDFGTAAAMVSFVQWGGGGIGRESVAAAADLWLAGDFIATAASGQSAQWKGTNSGGNGEVLSTDWANGDPTPGSENTPVPTAATSWGAVKALYGER